MCTRYAVGCASRSEGGYLGVAQPVRNRTRGLKDPVGGAHGRGLAQRGWNLWVWGTVDPRKTHLHSAPTALISRLRGGPKNFWGWLGVRMEWYSRHMAAHSPPIPLVGPREVQAERRNRWHLPSSSRLATG